MGEIEAGVECLLVGFDIGEDDEMFGFIVEEEYAECFVDAGGLTRVLYGAFAFGEKGEDGLEELLVLLWIVGGFCWC